MYIYIYIYIYMLFICTYFNRVVSAGSEFLCAYYGYVP